MIPEYRIWLSIMLGDRKVRLIVKGRLLTSDIDDLIAVLAIARRRLLREEGRIDG